MPHTKVYGFCDAKCKVEVAPKGDVEKAQSTANGKVSKSGDTMTGNLTSLTTSRTPIVVRANDEDWNTLPDTSYTEKFITFNDKNNVLKARIGTHIDGEKRGVVLQVIKDGYHGINIYKPDTGDAYAEAPTPSSATDSSTKIATTEWVNNIYNDMVHKSRAETITGSKTFTGAVTIKTNPVVSADIEKGFLFYRTDKALGDAWSRYRWDRTFDKNNALVGQILVINDNTGSSHSIISNNIKESDGSVVEGKIVVYARKSGETFAKCPTTPSDATGDEIATANWVNNKLANRVQKIPLTGTISSGKLELTNVQDGDVVVLTVNGESESSFPMVYTFSIPTSAMAFSSGNRAIGSSSHIEVVSGNSGVYAYDLSAIYENSKWVVTHRKVTVSNATPSLVSISKFEGYILRG